MGTVIWALRTAIAVALIAHAQATGPAEDVAAAVQVRTEVRGNGGINLWGDINQSVDVALYSSALAHSRWTLGLNVASSDSKANPNCAKLPGLCEAPFNCQQNRVERSSIATADGHPDWQTWCGSIYEEGAVKCQRGDLKGYGAAVHKAQLGVPFLGKTIETLDSHYCFSFGHCDNTEVTVNTTIEEAEAMCDKRFGPRWRTVSQKDLNVGVAGLRPGLYGAHFDQRTETAFAEMACAMGNFHCDVIYCKSEYCHQRSYIARYDTIRPAYGKKTTV